jgi:hypothetical protein
VFSELPLTVIEIIDEHRKNCLWRGKDFSRKGYNLAAWDLVRKPKDKGGLGVINLSIQNDALLLKQLDKFYRKKKTNGLHSSGRNTTAILFLIWQGKKAPSGGRTSLGFILRTGVLPFVTRIKGMPSVSRMISLMVSFTLRSSPIFCTLLEILPFPCSPLEMLIIYWIVSEFLCPELHTMSSLIYKTL